jgi:hypothetical protein
VKLLGLDADSTHTKAKLEELPPLEMVSPTKPLLKNLNRGNPNHLILEAKELF